MHSAPPGRSPHLVRMFLAVAVAVAAATVAACGGDSASENAAPAASPAPSQKLDETGNVISLVTRPDRTYTVGDIVAAGWKKSKEFDPSSLPRASAAVYGFYNQRDIEVWVYPSHAEALEFGVKPAGEAIAKKAGQTDYLIPVVNRFHAYAVAGNLVMLCEKEIGDCQALLAKLP